MKTGKSLPAADGQEIDPAATAAAILLLRHGCEPAEFGLEAVEVAWLQAVDCPAYRFRTPHERNTVLRWWFEHEQRLAARPAERR